MRFLVIFKVAFRALRRNKMRTVLTMLGIIIGVGAVIAMVALGRGAKAQVQARIVGSERAVATLQKEVACFTCPEDINDGEMTAPSKRLIRHVPRYEKLKVSVGAPAADAIGLAVLREKCPHFGQWLTRLERLVLGHD